MQWFVDVDGVLLNFERAFVAWLNGVYGLGLPEHYETENWFFEHLLPREKVEAAWEGFMESDRCGLMTPLVAPEKFNALTREDEVHLLTNFPARFMEKREQNLAALGFSYQALHYCGFHPHGGTLPVSKGNMVARLWHPGATALFVDDHPENCLDVVRRCEGVEVWVMTRRFNRAFAHPAVTRAHGWEPLFQRRPDLQQGS